MSDEMEEFEESYPRAVKLMRKRKSFIVIAEDEPYFAQAYAMIREHEKEIGRWTMWDEQKYREMTQPRPSGRK